MVFFCYENEIPGQPLSVVGAANVTEPGPEKVMSGTVAIVSVIGDGRAARALAPHIVPAILRLH